MAKHRSNQKFKRYVSAQLKDDIIRKEKVAKNYPNDSFWQTLLSVIAVIKEEKTVEEIIPLVEFELKKWGKSMSNYKYLSSCIEFLNGNNNVEIEMENF